MIQNAQAGSRRIRGFTLIELMIVVAIIAALAAYADAVRVELAPRGVHVLLVSPGPIRRAGDDPAADAQVGGIAHHHAGGQEVEFDPARGVPRVGAAVDLEHDRDRGAGAAQFLGNLGYEPALAFVAQGDADVSD